MSFSLSAPLRQVSRTHVTGTIFNPRFILQWQDERVVWAR